MEMLSETLDDSSSANPSSVKSENGSPPPDEDRGSPPPNCAICLGRCRNKSFTDSCLHQFCFKCLVTWSKVKTECPLCKQNFKSIIHNVQSNQQYEEYRVEQRRYEEDRIDIDDLVTATRRFRYRTTLTFPRNAGDPTALQRLLMHYPPLSAMVGMPSHLPGITPAALPTSRRRRSPSSFRRTIYRHNLWARPLPDFTGRHRDCTPEFYRYNNSQISRLVPWLNRELHYLLLENSGHIAYVMSRILELLPQYHITSPDFREEMYRYFGNRTDHFLHELHCFASTPYDLTGYDRNVQYTTDSRISNTVNDIISSSDTESDSDRIVITQPSYQSHMNPPRRPSSPVLPLIYDVNADTSRPQVDPVYPQNQITTPIAAAQYTRNVIPIETISHSDTDDDDVMVTGYIKPPHQRTPEVVDLRDSDDSDVVVVNEVPPEISPLPPRDAPGYVKLTFSHTRAALSDSNDDRTYTPPPHAAHGSYHQSSSSESPRSSLSSSSSSSGTATPPWNIDRIRVTRDRKRDWKASNVSEDTPRKKRARRGKEKKAVTASMVAESTSAANRSSSSDDETASEKARRERNKRKKSKSKNGKGVKSSRRDDSLTRSRRDESPEVRDKSQSTPLYQSSTKELKKFERNDYEMDYTRAEFLTPREEPQPGPSTSRSSGKGVKIFRSSDSLDSRRAESMFIQDEHQQQSFKTSGKGVKSSKRDECATDSGIVESTILHSEPQPGPSSSRAGGKDVKSSRRDNWTMDYRKVEPTTSFDPDLGPSSSSSSRGKAKSSRRDNPEMSRRSSIEAQPRADDCTPTRRNGYESKRLKSVVNRASPLNYNIEPSAHARSSSSSCSSSSTSSRGKAQNSHISPCSNDTPKVPRSPDFTDSDDDIPLNLTIRRSAK